MDRRIDRQLYDGINEQTNRQIDIIDGQMIKYSQMIYEDKYVHDKIDDI